MSEGPRFPFPFFGAEPIDWFDLDDDLFSYELRFATAPDAAGRRAIAEAWERALDPRAVDVVRPFLWAERWALVRVRPAGWSKACLADMTGAVQQALTRVHGVAPLEEVVLAEALESEGDWDAWSLAQAEEPQAGPRWPIELPKAAIGERFEAVCAVDPEAERAREEVRASLAAERDRPAPEEPAGGADDGEEEGAPVSRRADDGPKVVEGDLRLVRLRKGEAPRGPEVPDEVRKLFGARPEIAVAPDGRVYGVAKPRRRPPAAGWIEDGALRTADGGPLPRTYSAALAARDDSGAALLALDDDTWEVVFAEGRVTRLFEHGESISDVAYGPGDRIVLLVSSSLDVYRREGAGAALEQRWAVNGYSLRAVRGGRVLFVNSYEDGDDGVTVLGFDGPTVRRLARVTASVSELIARGGAVLMEHNGDDGEEFYEIAGWEALLDRLDAAPSAFPEVPLYTGPAHDEDEEEAREEEKSDDDENDDDDDDESEDDDDEGEGDSGGGDEAEERDSDDDDESEDDDDEDDDDEDDDDDAPKARRAKRPEDLAAPPAPGRVGLVYFGRKKPVTSRASAAIPKEVRSQFGGSRDIEQTDDGELYYGWKKEGKRSLRFAAIHQGRFVEIDVTAKSSSSITSPSWDRRRVLVPTDDDTKLWSVDLPGGKSTLVWDFSAEERENEVYSLEAVAFDRILVATSSEVWLFSLATGAPALEARGALDLRDVEVTCDGRAVVLEVSDGKPLRVWGFYEDGVRVLAELELEPTTIEVHGGGAFVQATENSCWYEIVNVEDAWQAARSDTSGARYPRLTLVKAARSKDEDEPEDEGGDDDEGDDDEGDEGDEGDDDEGDDDEGDGDEGDDDEGDDDEGDDDE